MEFSLGGQRGAIILGLSLSKSFKLTYTWQSAGSAFKEPHYATECAPLPMFIPQRGQHETRHRKTLIQSACLAAGIATGVVCEILPSRALQSETVSF